jgi:hypothetical protein
MGEHGSATGLSTDANNQTCRVRPFFARLDCSNAWAGGVLGYGVPPCLWTMMICSRFRLACTHIHISHMYVYARVCMHVDDVFPGTTLRYDDRLENPCRYSRTATRSYANKTKYQSHGTNSHRQVYLSCRSVLLLKLDAN